MIRPSALALAELCGYSAKLGAEYPTANENTDRGNVVDAQACDELKSGVKATDADAAAIVEWVRATFPEVAK